jgi:hypothetical protein
VAVHVVTNKRHFEKLTTRSENESNFDFKIHEINDILEKEKIVVPDEQDFSSALYCYLASRKLSLNHYAKPAEQRYFQHYRTGLGLRAAAFALLAIGMGIAATSTVKGWLYQETIAETTLIEQKYKAKFNQLSETQIDSTTSTMSMQHIVQTVDVIRDQFLRDPEEMMVLIADDVSIFPDIRVKKFDWFVSNYSNTADPNSVSWGKPSSRSRNVDRNKPKPKKGYFEIVLVEGEFLDFDGNYRYALSAVDDLEKAMVESGKYYSVEITKRPLDIEPDNQLSGNVGAGNKRKQDKAVLAFRVVREVPKGD